MERENKIQIIPIINDQRRWNSYEFIDLFNFFLKFLKSSKLESTMKSYARSTNTQCAKMHTPNMSDFRCRYYVQIQDLSIRCDSAVQGFHRVHKERMLLPHLTFLSAIIARHIDKRGFLTKLFGDFVGCILKKVRFCAKPNISFSAVIVRHSGKRGFPRIKRNRETKHYYRYLD